MPGRDHFQISQTNPNERAGGGGCLCSDAKLVDARGPFIVFHSVETDNAFSPYAVLCADCALHAAHKSGALAPILEAAIVARQAADAENSLAANEAARIALESAAATEAIAKVRAAAAKTKTAAK